MTQAYENEFNIMLVSAGSKDHWNPTGNALTTLFFKDLRKKLESSGITFNVCVVKTQNLINSKFLPQQSL